MVLEITKNNMPVPKIENSKKKSAHSKKAQKRDLVEPEPLEEEPSLKKVSNFEYPRKCVFR